VIAPSLTFVATTNAILYTGAEVRFADIAGLDDLTIAPERIERLINRRTKAIMVMHYGGFPCQLPEIMKIAEQHHLAVIEDAAHAPGGLLQEKALGTWGDAGCFSFFSNKNLSTGEGGMIVTERDDIASRARLLRSHGMTSLTWDRHRGHAYSYDVVELGYNYRLDEIRSALGLVQLGKLTANNERRRRITENYREALKDSKLILPFADREGKPAYHIFPVLLPESVERTHFIDQMRSKGIQTSIHYPPVHLFEYYRRRYPGLSLPLTEQAGKREVTLPLYPGLTETNVQDVVDAVRGSLDACEPIKPLRN
jgi:dTDP-4-amino-4,6-dideoxygalactose transaminase